MKIVSFVPIKLNNERFPGKNLRIFTNGEPLLRYILNTLKAIKNEFNADVYVYCSDETIINFLPKDVKFLKRCSSLDQNSTKINEVIQSFIQDIEADIYVMSHATSPFISSNSIRKGIISVMSGDYDSAFAVKSIQDFLWKESKPINYDITNIPRTQDLEKIYAETSGFYIFKKEVFNNNSCRIGLNPNLVEVNEIEAIDIDTKEDFEFADAIFNYRNLRID